jgi:molybdopterin-containing oxidoreductase family iron-sulfur binding subunit
MAGATAVASGKAIEFHTKKESELSKYKWGMVIDVEKCSECIKSRGGLKARPPCVEACSKANNVPRSDRYNYDLIQIYEVRAREDAEALYFPVMCQECEHPGCVQVCLTQASYKREDGIVVVDLHRCIGCRYCMIACPYNARRFLFEHPLEELQVVNPEAPIRKHGVVMKCEMCLWKIDKERAMGKEPKPVCVEACPYNAIVFGNLNDPNSEISKIIKTSKVITLRANLGTNPKVKYRF